MKKTMTDNENRYEGAISSDAGKDPVRVVFLTKKTSSAVKRRQTPELMSHPHLLLREMLVFEVLAIAMVILALIWNAPLEQLANPLLTPNPSKAPWYFLGLQELLHYFPPVVAGIIIPALVIVGLIIIPYFDINIKSEPMWSAEHSRRLWVFESVLTVILAFLIFYEAWTVALPTVLIGILALTPRLSRSTEHHVTRFLSLKPLSWWIMTWFVAVSVTLTVTGTFFRGPGWAWVWPWK